MSKYNEYRMHSNALLRIMGILNSTHVTCDTVENVPFMPKNVRLHFRRNDDGTWTLTVQKPVAKTLCEVLASEQ